jgi:hypothetical protein
MPVTIHLCLGGAGQGVKPWYPGKHTCILAYEPVSGTENADE